MMFLSSPAIADEFISDEFDYLCKERPNGNYPHPEDRTKFITCSNGIAVEMACPNCDRANNPERCAGSEYLVWDDRVSVKRCEYPAG